MGRRDLWCIALLIVIATIFFADVLFAGSNFFFRDLFRYHFPMKRIVRDAMLSGEFPFWNWSYSNGQPIAANPAYELFYPLQWLILAGSYPFGFAIHIVAHTYVALAGMYLLLREMPLGRGASMFGAFSFGMGGLLLGVSLELPTFFIWALAPLVAWSVLRALRGPAADRFALAALLGGMQLVIGEPIAIAQVWLLIGAGALLADRRRAIPVIGAVIVLALLVSAVQVIPAIDHLHDSVRSRGLPWGVVRAFKMPPWRPIELVIPHWFGVFTPSANAYWGTADFDSGFPYLYSIYSGIGVSILVLAGLFSRARGATTTAAIAVASYIIAIGDRTPLLHALYSSGIARGLRYSEKFAACGLVALIVFATTVADRLLAGDAKIRRAALIASAIVVAIAAVPAVWSLTPRFAASFVSYWRLNPVQGVLAAMARSRWLIGFAIAVLAALLIYLLPKVRPRVWLLLAFTLVLVDLLLVDDDLVPRLPASFFTPPGVVASLQSDRVAHATMNRSEWHVTELGYRRVHAELAEWFARNSLQPLTPGAWHLRTALELDFDETALLPTRDMLSAMMKLGNGGYSHWAESFAILSNVDTITDLLPIEAIVRQPHDLPNVRVVRITRLPSTGRFYFPQQVVQARTSDEIVAYIRRNGIRTPTAFVPFIPPPAANARVLAVDEHANGATIDVESAGNALLVITITRHKFWRATIDGRTAPLVPVNIAYQGVIVRAGRHRVALRYRNPVVVWSGVVSGASVVACFAAIVIAPIRRRRRLRSGS